MQWKPQLESKPWKDSINFYVDLLKNYGPPGSSANSFNEILALYNEGKCGMWIDATIAASFITDPKQSKVADKVAFAQAPTAVTPKGANWLWAWALAIPSGSKKVDAASKFRDLGDLQGVHRAGGQDQRLGPRADRHPQEHLRQP